MWKDLKNFLNQISKYKKIINNSDKDSKGNRKNMNSLYNGLNKICHETYLFKIQIENDIRYFMI
jgi:hypothetical protein